ncbi:endonuclease domain-containing protein [Sphingobium chlorophenolicum]|uniref:DUF559 domain-containing protein n=1 Tax=Sphingobium chlorophenolicum TaxID=46429 RepID=A0A081R892_SPHCR|nr:DUF559 domain-containing protein [Sphingobium chlorophenolicum]KEQ51415.1 hypothetical protein BV95_04317 [Sphingobium chlorophenolicum]
MMRNYRDLPSGSVNRAKTLRRNATEAEKRLWNALREKLPEAKFRRQVPHGPYVADFLNFAAKLVIEVDGATHAERTEQDAARTRYFKAQGYHVLRFWNHEVMENLDGVLTQISLSCQVERSHVSSFEEGGAKRRKGEDDPNATHPTPSPSHA